MQADYIKTVIQKIEQLPYNVVLFDGTWGIGKTYAISEALTNNDNVCKISMFGLSDANQIYHEVLFQLALKNNIGGKLGEIANNFLEGLSTVWEKAGQAKEIINNIAKEKELFLLLSKTFKTLHVVVIDDLERCSDKINLEEVFGIVEELKHCSYVKVIMVAHIEKIEGLNKEIFDKYNEKVIDRIYHITEISQDIDWANMKIHVGFITEFLEQHKVKNLRTLEKAQRFFDDVKLYCNNISDERFINEIRLICFAIVVETIDKLYYRDEESTSQNGLLVLHNKLEYRVANYLRGIMNSKNLVNILSDYYDNIIILNSDIFDTEYKLFLEAGNKANYYRTDEEIRILLPNLRERMNEADSIPALNRFVDEYVVWSDILEEDSSQVLQEYEDKLLVMLQQMILDGEDQILDYGSVIFHFSSKRVEDTYSEEVVKMRKNMIKNYVMYLQETTKGKKAYDYSYKLKQHFTSFFYRDLITGFAECLYNRKSFPIGEIDETQYYTCYNIMYILYEIDEDKLTHYCDELIKECDHMSSHRIKVILEKLKEK